MDPADTPQHSHESQRSYFVTPLRHPSHSPTRDGSPGRQNGLLNSWNTSGTGRKRSYKDLDLRALDPASQIQQELDARTEDEHADKRSRGPHWPLPSGSDKNGSKSSRQSRTPKRPTSQKGSARGRRRTRSSKFVEGSMRDRDSEAPPQRFMGDDYDMEDFMDNDMNVRRAETSEESNENLDAGIERSRPGSMYRFGKAIANAFNPTVVWHGVTGLFGKEKPNDSPLVEVMEQRKALAEKQYAELKKQGFQGTNKGESNRSSTDQSENMDSGIDMMDSGRMSREQKRDGLIFDRHGLPLLPPPPIPDDNVTSPETTHGSAPGTGKKSFMHRPSMPNLKKLKSRFSLPNIKKDPNSPLPTIENDEFTQKVKKKQSKKDLQKQAKLTKKISNLESQLDKARKELNKSKGIEEDEIEEEEYEEFEDEEMKDIEEGEEEDCESDEADAIIKQEDEEEFDDVPPPPPEHGSGSTRSKRFVPTLPSLPSERLLAAHVRTGQTPASRFPDRDLPPKTVNPDPLALSLEQALGMHDDDDEHVISPKKKPPPKKRVEKPTAMKTPAKKATSKKTPAKKTLAKKAPITTRSKGTSSSAKPVVNEEDEVVVSGEGDETPKINTKKATQKKGRKSSGNYAEDDKRFKPGSEDDDDEEWREATANPKKRVTRQSTGRQSSGASIKATKSDGAKGNATGKKATTQNKKENRKPSVQASSTSKNNRSTNSNLDSRPSGNNVGAAKVLTPSIYNDLPDSLNDQSSNESKSPASGVTDAVLFAEAISFASAQSRIVELSGAPVESTHLQPEASSSDPNEPSKTKSTNFPRRSDALSPSVPQIRSMHMRSPLATLERTVRSMSPPASATLSTLPGSEGYKLHHSNKSTLDLSTSSNFPSRKDSLRPRELESTNRSVSPDQRTPLGRPSSTMSSTAVPLPRGSPVRGNHPRSASPERPSPSTRTNTAPKEAAPPPGDRIFQTSTDANANSHAGDKRYEIKPLAFNGSPSKSRSSGSLTRPLSAHLEETNSSPGSNSSPARRALRRTGNGSPKPILKRAGRDGPITVTPSKGRGVPPVPVIPEGTVGIRAVVRKAREEQGKSVNLDDGWSGWDDDVF